MHNQHVTIPLLELKPLRASGQNYNARTVRFGGKKGSLQKLVKLLIKDILACIEVWVVSK